MRPSFYSREDRECSWMHNTPPSRPISLHGPSQSQMTCNGVVEIRENRIPLPTIKLRDSFIDRLKKRFTFRMKEDSPSPIVPDNVQLSTKSCDQPQNNNSTVEKRNEYTTRASLTDDSFMDTYLRPRKLSQRDINSINSTVLQSGVLVDPWLLSSMVQPLRQPRRSATDVGWQWRQIAYPPVPFSSASDSTRSSMSGQTNNDHVGTNSLPLYLRPPPPRYWLLAGFGWYWGPLTHSEASHLLCERPVGSFLVRDSEQVPGRLTLTYRCMRGEVLHHRITYREGRYFFVPGEEFDSLPDLICHAVECSRRMGVYCIARDSDSCSVAPHQESRMSCSNDVCLLEPVDRRKHVCSLHYLCRLVIRHNNTPSRSSSFHYSVKYKEEKGKALSSSSRGLVSAHDDSVWSCAWGKNEQDNTDYIVTGSLDDKVKVWKWNVDRLEHLHTLEGHHLGVISVDINKIGNMAASSSLDSQVRIWDLESGKQYRYIDGGPVDAWTVAFSPDSRFLASGSHTGNVNLFGVESAKKDNVIKLSGKFTLSIAYSPDGRHLAAGAIDGIISICEVPTGVVLPLDGHAMPVRALAFSPDGRYLVSASDDRQIKLYDVANGTPLCTLTGHSGLVVSTDFNSDNKHLVTCSSDKTVRVWDLRNYSLAHTYYEHDDQVWCVRFNPAGSKLISVGDDRQLVVYDCPQ